jgi:hypothetical protein
METPSPQSPENSVPACTTLPTEGWNRGRVDTSGRWSTMPKLASQPSPGWNLGGNWRLPGNRNIQTRHSQYIYIYTNHIYQPTTNQPTTNHLHHQLRTINHQPSTGRSKPQSTSWFLPDRSISSSPPGLWPWEESSDDGHQDGDFMDILWGFGQKWSLSHLIKINIV